MNNKPFRGMTKIIFFIPILTLACGLQAPIKPTNPITTPVNISVPPIVMPLITLPEAITNEEAVLIDLYNRVNPSVVSIIVYTNQGNSVDSSGQGSGFIYDENSHIITNAHVVQGADEVEVVFGDNSIRRGKIIGKDVHSDLAIVEVEDMPSGLLPLPLGDIEKVAVGQTVVAIGNPFGLGGTLTRGIVSALGRNIPALSSFSIPQSIQTDAPINPGNSGGPLLNLKGEVIGVNAQIETGGESRVNSGIGFAIPVSIISRVIPDLIQKGTHAWGWLGVVGGSLNPNIIEGMDLPVDKGAYVLEIVEGGPADQAGLKGYTGQIRINSRIVEIGGDVIIGIDGQPVTSFEDILIYIALKANPGQEVTLTIIRNGEKRELKAIIGERPNDSSKFFFNP